MSGGGKRKPDSWPEGRGAPLRGEKLISEAELTKVLEVDPTAETGVLRDIADATEDVGGGMTGAEASEKAGAIASSAGDWELEPELELFGEWRERWLSSLGAAGNRREGRGKSDIKPGAGAREDVDAGRSMGVRGIAGGEGSGRREGDWARMGGGGWERGKGRVKMGEGEREGPQLSVERRTRTRMRTCNSPAGSISVT